MKQKRGLIWIVIGLILIDVLRYVGMDGSLSGTSSTYIMAVITYLSFFWLTNSLSEDIRHSSDQFVKLWLFFSALAILYGLVLANDYWDYKHLFLRAIGFSITPLFYYLGRRSLSFIVLTNLFFKRLFWLGLIFIPIGLVTNYELYARLMIPVTFLILLFPFVNYRKRIVLLIVALLSMITAPDFRSLQLKIAAAALFLLFYNVKIFHSKRILLLIHFVIFLLPIFFIIAAFYSDYNFFRDGLNPNEEEYIVNVGESESNLLADTRTKLYLEVSNDLQGDEWIFGKSAVGSYQSSFYGEGGGDENGKRYACEVGILNILMRNGLVGVFLYLVLLFTITRDAIIKSSNYFVVSMALLLAIRWPLTFIEEFTQYDLNFFFFWYFLGLISLSNIQKFTNREISLFLRND